MPGQPDLNTASNVVHAALKHGRENGLRVSVAVVDADGHDLVVVRMDGAAWFTAGVARTKARTAASMRRPSAELDGLRSTYPELWDLIGDQLPFRPTTLPGGLPALDGDRVVAAVGVSGAHPDEDVACAQAGLDVLSPVVRSTAEA